MCLPQVLITFFICQVSIFGVGSVCHWPYAWPCCILAASLLLGHYWWCPVFACRDLVHRQTACWAVKHMALGVYGFGFEDAMTHLFNLVWPNMFEVSPHMVQAFTDAVDGMRVSVGPGKVLSYLLQARAFTGPCTHKVH